MDPSSESVGRHPVLACVDAMALALTEVGTVEVAFMTPADRRAALLELVRVEAQAASLRSRLLAVSDDLARGEGARDVAALVSHHARTDAGADRRDLALAESLERWTSLAHGLATGEVNVAQARVVARALDALPAEEVPSEVLGLAEAHLVAAAADFGPRELRLLGRRVLDVVAPDVAEQQEARQLGAEERRAWRRTSLTSARLGDGTTRLVLQVPDGVAARLHTYLDAFTSPRHLTAGEADRVPVDVRRGQAFCALLEACDPRRLPVHGGDATTVMVTVSLDSLRRDVGSAELGPDDALSPAEVRRLACTAGIVPVVLGGASEVLDLGRSSRLFRPAQRRAMVVRDRECRARGCTIPAAWCEAHHRGRPWAQGGRTDLADGELLCSWHHHVVHDPAYVVSRMPNGDVRFARRT